MVGGENMAVLAPESHHMSGYELGRSSHTEHRPFDRLSAVL